LLALGYTAGDVLYIGSAFFISIVPLPGYIISVPSAVCADSMMAVLNRMIFCPFFSPSCSSIIDSYVVAKP